MYFEKIGNLTIEDLGLEPAPDLGLAIGFGLFRAGENIVLQVLKDRRVFMDCTKGDQTDTYTGTCSTAELIQLQKMMEEAT